MILDLVFWDCYCCNVSEKSYKFRVIRTNHFYCSKQTNFRHLLFDRKRFIIEWDSIRAWNTIPINTKYFIATQTLVSFQWNRQIQLIGNWILCRTQILHLIDTNWRQRRTNGRNGECSRSNGGRTSILCTPSCNVTSRKKLARKKRSSLSEQLMRSYRSHFPVSRPRIIRRLPRLLP